jgi:hypothetical protein
MCSESVWRVAASPTTGGTRNDSTTLSELETRRSKLGVHLRRFRPIAFTGRPGARLAARLQLASFALVSLPAAASPQRVEVAADGSGDFTTIQATIDQAPAGGKDGVDNDGDGLTDLTSGDAGCASLSDFTETAPESLRSEMQPASWHCALGPELALVIRLLHRAKRRRRGGC